MTTTLTGEAQRLDAVPVDAGSRLTARLERLPMTRPVMWARGCVGMATFFDGYTTIAIAYAMPILAHA